MIVVQIFSQHTAEQIVPINFSDETSCVFIVGNIRGVLRKKITDNLIDGVIAFFKKRRIHLL